LNRYGVSLLLALVVVPLLSVHAAVEPLYVTVHVDTTIVDTAVALNIRGRVTGLNQSAVALASVSIQVNDPYGNNLHIALVYSDNSGEYSDTFQLQSGRRAINYAIDVTASKFGFQDAYAKLAFSVRTPPFLISISPASVTVEQGKNATFRLVLESMDPSIAPVYVQVVGLPTHVSYSLSSSTLTVPSAVTLTVETSEQVAPGSYYSTIIGTSSQGESNANFEIIIAEAKAPIQYVWAVLLAAALLVIVMVYGLRKRKRRKKTLNPSTLVSLPDHLRNTAVILCQLGEASAVEVAARSGKTRAAESDYLNQLVRMGLLKKKHKGRESYFMVE